MMQGQKYEFNRKPRRLLGRSPGGSTTRLRSKEQEDPRSPIHRTPQKKQQLIVSLRAQLGNLKQELSSIEHRQDETPSTRSITEQQQSNQCRAINEYYFEPGEQKGRGWESNSLARQLSTSREKNHELEKVNHELRKRLKQLGKQKEAKRFSDKSPGTKDREQADRTISIQKQLLESKKASGEMKVQIQLLLAENEALKGQIQRLKAERQQISTLRDELISKCAEIDTLHHSIKQLKGEIEVEQQKSRQKEKQLRQSSETYTKISLQIKEMTAKNKELKKQAMKYRQEKDFLEADIKNKENPRKMDQKRLRQLHELREVVLLQQKSMRNQQSDINYLESEVRKMAYWRQLSQRQAQLLYGVNQAVMGLQMNRLSQKYAQ